MHVYSPARPLGSIKSALEAAGPDLVISCDDRATAQLHRLHSAARDGHGAGSPLRDLLERSLGLPSSFPIIESRSSLLALAREEGIRAPVTNLTDTRGDLEDWLARNGFPAILKADGTFSGGGVRVVDSLRDAHRAFDELSAPPSIAQTAKRMLVHGDVALISPCILRTSGVVSAQRFVAGEDTNIAVACWQGTILASIAVRALRTRVPRGPSSLVQIIDNDEMLLAATTIVRKLGLTGLYGLDFILDKRDKRPHLIEMNPRATQTCHLRLGPGRDLPGALTEVLSGGPAKGNTCLTTRDVIALFPQELQRDPTGEMLAMAYHDVPWDQLDLIKSALAETLYIRRRAIDGQHSTNGSGLLLTTAGKLRAFLLNRLPWLEDAAAAAELQSILEAKNKIK
jgi:hypothetical protein